MNPSEAFAIPNRALSATICFCRSHETPWRACNWFAVITLDVGASLQEIDAPFAAEVREGALAALTRVHAAGCLHGDVALRNFVLCP
ncbi:Hypothetical Protein FCC1311_010382 [Hondaea fermentalgiana]|uniref:Protein kinase domain-containing protein n=1 Tax=Hondaea fermentalgiana TaxID=2315210 RepID=A0A2R5G1D7_9STRA|nr:Hypothetical Protein FCC1311_010382 [Hondaea fermentalgiana]|eukprot:GBG24820.1 Hypothetical Protein FCC1311_010382 [Hondaea fermentalgiana]